jgi:Undecaprenyl-phosphate galactose phosphotransferase WbaP
MVTSTTTVPVHAIHLMKTARNRWLTQASLVTADLGSLSIAWALVELLHFISHPVSMPDDFITFLPWILTSFIAFLFVGLYPGIGIGPIDEFRLVMRASSISILLFLSGSFFVWDEFPPQRRVYVFGWLITIVLAPIARGLVREWCSRRTWWGVPTVILGEPEAGRRMLSLLSGDRHSGVRPVALLLSDPAEDDGARTATPHSVFVGELNETTSRILEFRDCYAVVAMPNAGPERLRDVFNRFANQYHKVLIIPGLLGMRSLSVSAGEISGVLALTLEQPLTLLIPRALKRGFDLAISIPALLILLPFLLLIALLVKSTSRGPILYGHVRVGRDNRRFKLWKFRSMVVNGDEILKDHFDKYPGSLHEWEREHKLRNDPRITRLGKILRHSSLDELPQLWNVIRGDMSIVGPRPIVDAEIAKYGYVYPQYQRVTPGITGLWQISGRNNLTYGMRTQIDDYYVRNWSLSLDLYILYRTIKTVVMSEGAY